MLPPGSSIRTLLPPRLTPIGREVGVPWELHARLSWSGAFDEDQHGTLWHAYRRGWATARKDLPLKDVAAVGGWKDIQTLVNCYQQADDDTMLLVMSHPKKISERVPSS